jgi:hypothetical protein
MADEEYDLAGALFDVEVAKVKAAKIRAEEDELLQYVSVEAHFGENNGDHWLLDGFEVSMAEVAYWGRGANTSEKDGKVVNPGVVGFACAEDE